MRWPLASYEEPPSRAELEAERCEEEQEQRYLDWCDGLGFDPESTQTMVWYEDDWHEEPSTEAEQSWPYPYQLW